MVLSFLPSTLILLAAISLTPAQTSPLSPQTGFTVVEQTNANPIWVVKENESLSSIAEVYYGDSRHWTTLWNDNPQLDNPNIIDEGWVLSLRPEPPQAPEALKKELAERLSVPIRQFVPQVTQVAMQPQPSQSVAIESTGFRPSNFDTAYKEAGAKYGVPWQILYGLHLTETGLRDGDISNHSGSGAQGPMQFMPGTWKAYGVDGNGDGIVDINNAVDAIHGAANFMAKHGSIMNGLHYYGGNTAGTLSAARSRGFTL